MYAASIIAAFSIQNYRENAVRNEKNAIYKKTKLFESNLGRIFQE